MGEASVCFQRCMDCGTFQYPVREICRHCLGDRFKQEEVSDKARVIAKGVIHHSLEACFLEYLPLSTAKVLLADNISIIAFVPDEVKVDHQVIVSEIAAPNGKTVFVGVPLHYSGKLSQFKPDAFRERLKPE